MVGNVKRCDWAESEWAIPYHDQEWGVPVHDDRVLFEFLVLGGAQAGLSWQTILKKRDTYRVAFDYFDPVVVARYGDAKVQSLLADPGIIRNRQKVASAVANAKVFVEAQREFGSFDKFIWGFVGGSPNKNAWNSDDQVPATSRESDAMSKELKRRGFKFVGSTICYAVMQTVGLVNDHTVDCFRYDQV